MRINSKKGILTMIVGIIGAGTMGSGIAQAFAQCEGFEVRLCDITEELAARGRGRIERQLTKRVQNAGTEVVEAKAGAGSATLSMAAAGARFALAIVAGLQGVPGVVESAYVADEKGEYAPFFARQVLLGQNGVAGLKPVGKLSDYEKKCLDDMLPGLKKDIQLGVDFVNGNA